MKNPNQAPSAPLAKKITTALTEHGHQRTDHYYWMNQRDNPEVISYLEAENAYTELHRQKFLPIEDEIYKEIRSRIKEDDESAPSPDRSFEYFSRFKAGEDYSRIYRRRKGVPDAEELLLDQVALAKDKSYFHIGDWDLSENENLLAYSTDSLGRRIYSIQIKDLSSQNLLEDRIEQTSGEIVWANNDSHFFYVRKDPQSLRSFQVYRHRIGTPASSDSLVFEERDPEFFVSLAKSKDRKYIFVISRQTECSEFRMISAEDPEADFEVFFSREKSLIYDLEHFDSKFFILNNWKAPNFQIHSCQKASRAKEDWKIWLPHRQDVFIEDFDLFKSYMVIEERKDGLVQLRVKSYDSQDDYQIEFPEPCYLAGSADNSDIEIDQLRYFYSSMTTPDSLYEYDLNQRTQRLLKQKVVKGDFQPKNYKSERLLITARDGQKIPVSLVYSEKAKSSGPSPLLLYAYGSYGNSLDAYFSIPRLSLLDRGFVFAIAHVRGGEEMGRIWYDQGKLLHKKNTFFDFIDVAEALIQLQRTSSDRLYMMGGSAGGLLVGAVMNLRPELFHGAVADVPFVDVVTTMLDESLPLTTFEFEEWGNPKDKTFYDYMLSYSPYDNVSSKDYPHLLVTAGLHDSQVQYWEPAKWVAKLRDLKTDEHLLLLKTHMGAGHGGASARFESLKEIAFEYAFLLYLDGLRSKEVRNE